MGQRAAGLLQPNRQLDGTLQDVWRQLQQRLPARVYLYGAASSATIATATIAATATAVTATAVGSCHVLYMYESDLAVYIFNLIKSYAAHGTAIRTRVQDMRSTTRAFHATQHTY